MSKHMGRELFVFEDGYWWDDLKNLLFAVLLGWLPDNLAEDLERRVEGVEGRPRGWRPHLTLEGAAGFSIESLRQKSGFSGNDISLWAKFLVFMGIEEVQGETDLRRFFLPDAQDGWQWSLMMKAFLEQCNRLGIVKTGHRRPRQQSSLVTPPDSSKSNRAGTADKVALDDRQKPLVAPASAGGKRHARWGKSISNLPGLYGNPPAVKVLNNAGIVEKADLERFWKENGEDGLGRLLGGKKKAAKELCQHCRITYDVADGNQSVSDKDKESPVTPKSAPAKSKPTYSDQTLRMGLGILRLPSRVLSKLQDLNLGEQKVRRVGDLVVLSRAIVKARFGLSEHEMSELAKAMHHHQPKLFFDGEDPFNWIIGEDDKTEPPARSETSPVILASQVQEELPPTEAPAPSDGDCDKSPVRMEGALDDSPVVFLEADRVVARNVGEDGKLAMKTLSLSDLVGQARIVLSEDQSLSGARLSLVVTGPDGKRYGVEVVVTPVR